MKSMNEQNVKVKGGELQAKMLTRNAGTMLTLITLIIKKNRNVKVTTTICSKIVNGDNSNIKKVYM